MRISYNWRGRYQWSAVLNTVAVLVLYNVACSMWLLAKPFEFSRNLSTSIPLALPCPETTPKEPYDPLAQLDLRLGRWDATHGYKAFDYVAVGDFYSQASTTRQVCLATQSSIESLKEILKTAEHWSGPISLAVLIIGDEMKLLQAFAVWLSECQPGIYSRLALHIATPAESPASFETIPSWARNCSAQPLPRDELTIKTNKWIEKHPYPQNLLRNLARKNCHTPYVYMVDVDIVPSIGMAESLDQFLKTTEKCSMCAYVIPTYELDWSANFPMNKSELLQLTIKKLAVPFHKNIYIYNQLSSNLTTWEASGRVESNETHISHNVTDYKLFYEPFYVAPDTVPPHDERFLGYGFTRNSQVYEMFLLNYQFKVLSPVFSIHWGLQSAHRPRWRYKQSGKNYGKFKIFQKELYAKYKTDPLGLFSQKPENKKIIGINK